mmetsp:Transcript_37980/g.55780  ORF Transcript_37980/g.55780 Transcript_37980/m.55780 type:complete len:202 (-) Transcript_37980:369-974(-)|eukprot:CAMPEP_0179436370 /NCGR_PEP_ID=MMETSP0799-20121207/20377_1 /TAXON_ID=46947 /ORGANISM="Geminigera cryophila, Strain CCMP2564" /LENGTH=201 /DNA_ID=CAMNT_0021216467 /DNA_START=35 /DNA_END=640 /DNA_ORIENTATION=-
MSVAPGEKRHGYIGSLIYWTDPKTSAAVLLLGLGFFLLTVFFRYSYTALICMFFLVHLLVSAIYSFVQQWNNKKVGDWTREFKVDRDEASKIALRVALDYNKAVDWYFGLAAARDLGTLGIVLGVLFGMWTVATIFSDSGLCLIAFILAFIVPVMYEKNQLLFDKQIQMLKTKIVAMIPVAEKATKATPPTSPAKAASKGL